jgi:spore maturation protein CgeB
MGEDNPLRNLVRRLPLPVKSALGWVLRRGPVKYAGFEDSHLDFDELNEMFFQSAQRCPAYSKAISSRHFDAIGTKTCQIMLEGRYNDILVANEHYLEVALDHSNLDEVIERFKDPVERHRISETAYEFVMQGHTYAHRMAALHEAVVQI